MQSIKQTTCVIMDWAGTAVDFGCFAPVNAFIQAFDNIGLAITEQEVRVPMGLAKVEHIRQLLQMPRINSLFKERIGRIWTEEDVNNINRSFEEYLFASLQDFTTPVPGVIETMKMLREEGVKIGSTTGYTSAMMDIVRKGAASLGYEVDCCVTPDQLPAGRPAPFMIFSNMMQLDIRSLNSVIKVGDTIEDMKEGCSAKVTTVGVVRGSSLLGLSLEEMNNTPDSILNEKIAATKQSLFDAGADYVIETIAELPGIIKQLNTQKTV